MHSRIQVIAAMLLATAALCACDRSNGIELQDAKQADLLISNTTVINGHSVSTGVDVVILDGLIIQVARHTGDREAGQVIDGSGRYVVPGLVDAHTHPFPVERSFPQFIHYGVTSIFVTGCGRCDNDSLSDIRAMGNDRTRAAPRVFHTSQHFTMEGRHPVKTYPGPNWVEGKSVYYIRDVSGIAGLVEEVAGHPNVGIKLTIEEGPTPPFVERMPQAFVTEVVNQAHSRGLPVFAHVSDMDELRMAHEAGVDHLLHFTGVDLDWSRDADIVADLVERDVHWVTTLMLDKSFLYPINPQWIAAARETGLFDENLESAARFGMSEQIARRNAELVYGSADASFESSPVLQKQFADLRRLHASGIRLVTGTDVGNFYILPGYSLHEEMALLEQGGFSPVEILELATINAAVMLGNDDRIGSVDEGKVADLILLNSDPRASVENLSDISMVLKSGNVLRDER